MRRPPIILLLALAAFLAACTGSQGPGWTFAPATEAPSVAPSPSGEAPEPTPVPTGDGGGGGEAIELAAVNIQWEQTELSAPADTPFVIRFDNRDAGVPHNVEIKDSMNMTVFKGEIFNGVAVRDYQVPALPAGSYTYICTVHPNMVGTLTVGG